MGAQPAEKEMGTIKIKCTFVIKLKIIGQVSEQRKKEREGFKEGVKG